MEKPRISIITVCFNAEKHIEKAIQSVLSQTHQNIEHIIIDGGSKDNTMTVVNKYRDRLAKIISEPDQGIYDAMNKGIKLSSGDILYFLNADDRLGDELVTRDVASYFRDATDADIIYGEVKFCDVPDTFKFIYGHTPGWRDFNDVLLNGACHQAIFVKRKIFEKIGLFNTQFKIHADFDWILRAYRNKAAIKKTPRLFAICSAGGVGFTQRNSTIGERIKVVIKNTPLHMIPLYGMLASARKLKEFIKIKCSKN